PWQLPGAGYAWCLTAEGNDQAVLAHDVRGDRWEHRTGPRPSCRTASLSPANWSPRSWSLEPLGPQHNAGDYEARTSSIDHIRATPDSRTSAPHPGSSAVRGPTR